MQILLQPQQQVFSHGIYQQGGSNGGSNGSSSSSSSIEAKQRKDRDTTSLNKRPNYIAAKYRFDGNPVSWLDGMKKVDGHRGWISQFARQNYAPSDEEKAKWESISKANANASKQLQAEFKGVEADRKNANSGKSRQTSQKYLLDRALSAINHDGTPMQPFYEVSGQPESAYWRKEREYCWEFVNATIDNKILRQLKVRWGDLYTLVIKLLEVYGEKGTEKTDWDVMEFYTAFLRKDETATEFLIRLRDLETRLRRENITISDADYLSVMTRGTRWHVRANPAEPDLCKNPFKRKSVYNRLIENVAHEQVGLGRDYDVLEWEQQAHQD